MNKVKFLVSISVLICCFMSCSAKKMIIEDEAAQRSQTTDVLLKHGLNGIKINYDMAAMESLSTDDIYSYLDALDLAIESFLTDKSNVGSPLAIIPTALTSYKGNESKSQQHLMKLLELINTGGSLCMPDIEDASYSCSHAEEGEDVENNWIFLLEIAELSDHNFWAIVPKDGKEAVYNYGFD